MEDFTLKQLLQLNLSDVRKIAQAKRVPSPTTGRKEDIAERIIKVQSGEIAPSNETRGKKPNDNNLDMLNIERAENPAGLRTSLPELSADPCDDEIPYIAEEEPEIPSEEEQNTKAVQPANCSDVSQGKGVLEVMPEGHGFLRVNNFYNSNQDIYVQQKHIGIYGLKSGDFVEGKIRKFDSTKLPSMIFIDTVNGFPLDKLISRPQYDALKASFPDRRIRLEGKQSRLDFALRAIDLVAPIGMGQRALIVSPPKAGKTILLKKIAQAIINNHPDIHVIMLLVDERPEEVTDIEADVACEIASSTFDQSPSHHIKVADLALKRAKRLVEAGRDVVILMDSITRLSRAYNTVAESSGKTLSGGLDAAALIEPKKFFGSARNVKGAGSLTIIATALVDTGSRMDDIIYEEFKGTGNMEIHLSRKLSERRIFPAIDLNASGTRREDLLLSEKELTGMWLVRKLLSRNDTADSAEVLIDMLTKTISNDEFLERLNERSRMDKW